MISGNEMRNLLGRVNGLFVDLTELREMRPQNLTALLGSDMFHALARDVRAAWLEMIGTERGGDEREGRAKTTMTPEELKQFYASHRLGTYSETLETVGMLVNATKEMPVPPEKWQTATPLGCMVEEMRMLLVKPDSEKKLVSFLMGANWFLEGLMVPEPADVSAMARRCVKAMWLACEKRGLIEKGSAEVKQ